MQLPTFLDLARIGELTLLVSMVIQYIKNGVPEKLIKPYLQIGFGLLFSWLALAYVSGTVNPVNVPWVKVIVDGVVAGLAAEWGYAFLSSKDGSPAFSLPARSAK